MAVFSNIELRPTLARWKGKLSLEEDGKWVVAVELFKEGALDLGGQARAEARRT